MINSGSSSCKFTLYRLEETNLGEPQSPIWNSSCELHDLQISHHNTKEIKEKLESMPIPSQRIDVIGHRIVHGGNEFLQPVIINETVKKNSIKFHV